MSNALLPTSYWRMVADFALFKEGNCKIDDRGSTLLQAGCYNSCTAPCQSVRSCTKGGFLPAVLQYIQRFLFLPDGNHLSLAAGGNLFLSWSAIKRGQNVMFCCEDLGCLERERKRVWERWRERRSGQMVMEEQEKTRCWVNSMKGSPVNGQGKNDSEERHSFLHQHQTCNLSTISNSKKTTVNAKIRASEDSSKLQLPSSLFSPAWCLGLSV